MKRFTRFLKINSEIEVANMPFTTITNPDYFNDWNKWLEYMLENPKEVFYLDGDIPEHEKI